MSRHETSLFLTRGKLLCVFGSLLVVLLPSAVYANEACTLATIAGPYVFATVGQQAGGSGASLFLMTNDGNGNLSGRGAESFNGTILPSVTATGTYTVTKPCWFTATTVDSSGNIRNIAGVIDQKGHRISGISTDAGTGLQFTAFRQNSGQCQGSIVGYFTSKVQSPLTPNGPATATEQWYIAKKLAGTGSSLANYNGTVVEGSATATYSLNSDCTYTSTETNSDGTTGHFFGVQGIDGFNNVVWFTIKTDNGWASLRTSNLLCMIWPRC